MYDFTNIKSHLLSSSPSVYVVVDFLNYIWSFILFKKFKNIIYFIYH
jgi:hypothetical protein